jgi:hypothetical protein
VDVREEGGRGEEEERTMSAESNELVRLRLAEALAAVAVAERSPAGER